MSMRNSLEVRYKLAKKITINRSPILEYKGFKIGDRVTIKTVPTIAYNFPDIYFGKVNVGVIAHIPPKVRIVKNREGGDTLPYFACVDFVLDEKTYRTAINFCNLKKI